MFPLGPWNSISSSVWLSDAALQRAWLASGGLDVDYGDQ